MTRENIIKQILLRIDEISPFKDADIIDNNLIDGLLNETAEDVLMKLPLHLLPSTTVNSISEITDSILTKFQLPTDFLRLIKLRLSSWIKPVNELLPEEHPKFQLQYNNKYLRGTVNRPIAFIVNASTSNKEAYCFGKGVVNTVSQFYYCKKTLPESMPDNILEPMFYMGAFKVLVAMEKPEVAKVAITQFENFVKRNTIA